LSAVVVAAGVGLPEVVAIGGSGIDHDLRKAAGSVLIWPRVGSIVETGSRVMPS
jgi:hypothetical protein